MFNADMALEYVTTNPILTKFVSRLFVRCDLKIIEDSSSRFNKVYK